MEASSAINAPHPDEPGDAEAEAAAFFEEDEPGTEAAGDEGEAEAKQAEPEVKREAEADPSDPTPGKPAESAGQTEAPGDSPNSESDKTRGAAEREYIVFQKLALSEKVLKGLLKEIEDGKTAGPRLVYVELHRAVTRNDRQAIGEGYKANRKELGDECELAAVSSRSFKERKVRPREVRPADDVQIV